MFQRIVYATLIGLFLVVLTGINAARNYDTSLVELCVVIGGLLVVAGAFEAGVYFGAKKADNTKLSQPHLPDPVVTDRTDNFTTPPAIVNASNLDPPTRPRKMGMDWTKPREKVSKSKPTLNRRRRNTKFEWRCKQTVFTTDEIALVEKAGPELNSFVQGRVDSSALHQRLTAITTGEVEAVNQEELAWEKYIVRCDIETPREIVIPEGFAGSREAVLEMRFERYRQRYWKY